MMFKVKKEKNHLENNKMKCLKFLYLLFITKFESNQQSILVSLKSVYDYFGKFTIQQSFSSVLFMIHCICSS